MCRRRLPSLCLVLCLLTCATAAAKRCKKGKQPCGGQCISIKKECREQAPPAAGTPDGAEAAPVKCKKGKKPCGGLCIPKKKPCQEQALSQPQEKVVFKSDSSEVVNAALSSPAGRAMLQLAQALKRSGDLDVDEKGRGQFRQGLRGLRPPLQICDIGHIQLVRECDQVVGGNVTLPCYLAVDEMAAVCKLLGQEMKQVK
jgi:hypothetical protein